MESVRDRRSPSADNKGDKLSGIMKKSGTLEHVLLPAGCYVYYVRDENGAPHFQTEILAQSLKGSKAAKKGLGVVGPECSEHRKVEQEYAVIREVVEVYLEEQLVGEKESRYRVGGPLQEQKQLLARLAASNVDLEDTTLERSLVPDEEHATSQGDLNQKLPAVRPVHPVKGPRCAVLPISKSLHEDATPRGPFLVKGRAFREYGRNQTAQNSTEAMLGGKTGDDAKAAETDKRPFVVAKAPLSDRRDVKKERELERGFDVIRTTQQKYPTPGADNKKRDRRILVPDTAVPLQLMAEKSPIEDRDRGRKNRENAGMTPKYTTRPGEEIPSETKGPSTTFRETSVRGPQAQRAWKPSESRKGPVVHQPPPAAQPLPQQVQGRSFVTRMPSKIILNVVLPREDSSQDARLCSRVQNLERLDKDTRKPSSPHPSAASSPPPSPGAGDDRPSADEAAQVSSEGKPYSKSQVDEGVDVAAGDGMSTAASKKNTTDPPSASAEIPEGSENKSNVSGKSVDFTYKTTRHELRSDPDSQESPEKSQDGPVEGKAESKVPSLNLGPRMVTAESTFHSMDPAAQQTCRRATHCDLFGPDLCADCEAEQHRQQFTARQDVLYPQIDVFPRHMVATQKFKESASKGDGSHRQGYLGFGSQPRWPYVSFGQLKEVVTDLDLCKRIVEKGHRAKLPSGF